MDGIVSHVVPQETCKSTIYNPAAGSVLIDCKTLLLCAPDAIISSTWDKGSALRLFMTSGLRLDGVLADRRKNPGLASVEQSRDASGNGGPSKVGLVGGTTAGGKIHAIGSIRADSKQGGIKLIKLVG
jgi:hypothetical protein